jgi:hypothetical protein
MERENRNGPLSEPQGNELGPLSLHPFLELQVWVVVESQAG